MRTTRQTELEREFPLHVVCAWLGNTEAVAKKNYLLVTESDYQKAAQLAIETAQKAAQQGIATTTQGDTETQENTGESDVFPHVYVPLANGG